MERSRSNKHTWLFDKQDIVAALEGAVDTTTVSQALDHYLDEQFYIARIVAGAVIIEEIDKHQQMLHEGGKIYGNTRIIQAAHAYLETASQIDHDDYFSGEFQTIATELIENPDSGLGTVSPAVDDLRQDLIAQGFAFDNMDEGENSNVSTD